MALKYEIDSLDGVEESLRALYTKDGDIYRLDVDGVDKDAREGLDKVKEALRKEREERAEAKKQVSELQAEKERAEKEALEKRNKEFAVQSTLDGLTLISNLTELFGKKGEKQAKKAFQIQKQH